MIIGNTVRLRAEFKDLDDNYYDPDDVVVTVYNCSMTAIATTDATRDSTGQYYHDYTLTADDYAFEFSGVIPHSTFSVLSRMALSASSRL